MNEGLATSLLHLPPPLSDYLRLVVGRWVEGRGSAGKHWKHVVSWQRQKHKNTYLFWCSPETRRLPME